MKHLPLNSCTAHAGPTSRVLPGTQSLEPCKQRHVVARPLKIRVFLLTRNNTMTEMSPETTQLVAEFEQIYFTHVEALLNAAAEVCVA